MKEMLIKRFDTLDIATTELGETAGTYARNFNLAPALREGDDATIEIGNAQIRLRSGAAVGDLIAASGEGLAAIWLEADDVAQVAAALTRARIPFAPVRREGARRVLAIDPSAANQVPLFIFDRPA